MKCLLCKYVDADATGKLCGDCSASMEAVDILIEDLGEYLPKADSARLQEYYSKNLSYFISTLSAYNRYVSVKNLIQELIFLRLFDGTEDPVFASDVENNEPLKTQRIVEILRTNDLLTTEYDTAHSDLMLDPGEKIRMIEYVRQSFGMDGAGLTDYLNAVLLYSMLVVIQEDIKDWIRGVAKSFPRRGFYPLRMIAGAIRRAISGETSSHYIKSDEIYYALRTLTPKGKIKAFSQLVGMDFQSKSIFREIPKKEDGSSTELTADFSELIVHIAERKREHEREQLR